MKHSGTNHTFSIFEQVRDHQQHITSGGTQSKSMKHMFQIDSPKVKQLTSSEHQQACNGFTGETSFVCECLKKVTQEHEFEG